MIIFTLDYNLGNVDSGFGNMWPTRHCLTWSDGGESAAGWLRVSCRYPAGKSTCLLCNRTYNLKSPLVVTIKLPRVVDPGARAVRAHFVPMAFRFDFEGNTTGAGRDTKTFAFNFGGSNIPVDPATPQVRAIAASALPSGHIVHSVMDHSILIYTRCPKICRMIPP